MMMKKIKMKEIIKFYEFDSKLPLFNYPSL